MFASDCLYVVTLVALSKVSHLALVRLSHFTLQVQTHLPSNGNAHQTMYFLVATVHYISHVTSFTVITTVTGRITPAIVLTCDVVPTSTTRVQHLICVPSVPPRSFPYPFYCYYRSQCIQKYDLEIVPT
jgi:hypothetical protein